MKAPRSLELLMWVGIFGAPVVWASQHVFGFGVTQVACSPGGSGWMVPVDTWTGIATSLAGALAIAALTASVLAFRRVRGADNDTAPPDGRIYFLSICGMVISPIFLAIILMSGIGTLLLSSCRQG